MKKDKKNSVFYVAMVFILLIILGLGSTCSSTSELKNNVLINNETIMITQSKMYIDIMCFNDNVILPFGSGRSQRKPHNMETQTGMEDFLVDIRDLPSGANTAALYALDIGLDRIVHVKNNFMQNDLYSRYYLIFLTDGLDNVSVDLAQRNRRGLFTNTNEYVEALQERMSNLFTVTTSVRDPVTNLYNSHSKPNTTNSFQSFVLFYKGNDIIKSGYTDEELNQLVMPFTGSQNEQRPSLIMSDDLNLLYEEFENEFGLSFSFNVPKGYEGKRIRMLLNDEKKIWFEGDLVKEIKSVQSGRNEVINTMENITTSNDFSSGQRGRNEVVYTMENVTTSNGFSFNNSKITMDNSILDNNSNTVPFIINGLKLNNKSYIVRPDDNVQQWFYDDNKLRLNSELKKSNKKNAYILFILDTSFSFKDEINKAKNTIIRIVNYIKEQM